MTASFTLVHGSGQNADSWSRVASILRERGHEVTAPDLPKGALGWRLEDYAAKVAESVAGPESVVVAHSQCGALLPLVPAIRGCGLLVFLAAVIPEPGKSIRQQFLDDPSMFSHQWIAAAARWSDKSLQQSLAMEFMFHDCDAETLAWALGTSESIDPEHLLAKQPAPFVDWPRVPMASIVATADRTLTPAWGRRMTRSMLRTEAIEIEAGHCPHVSRARETADLLEQLTLAQR